MKCIRKLYITLYKGDQTEEYKMVGACGTFGGRKEVHKEFWRGNLKGRDRWEDVDADEYYNGLSAGREIVDWIHLAQDREKWRVLVSVAINFRAP
jgi:hypothetical protein